MISARVVISRPKVQRRPVRKRSSMSRGGSGYHLRHDAQLGATIHRKPCRVRRMGHVLPAIRSRFLINDALHTADRAGRRTNRQWTGWSSVERRAVDGLDDVALDRRTPRPRPQVRGYLVDERGRLVPDRIDPRVDECNGLEGAVSKEFAPLEVAHLGCVEYVPPIAPEAEDRAPN